MSNRGKAGRDQILASVDLFHFWRNEYEHCPCRIHLEVATQALASFVSTCERYMPREDTRLVSLRKELAKAYEQLTSPMAGVAKGASTAVGPGNTDSDSA